MEDNKALEGLGLRGKLPDIARRYHQRIAFVSLPRELTELAEALPPAVPAVNALIADRAVLRSPPAGRRQGEPIPNVRSLC